MSTATRTASASTSPEVLGRNLPSDFLNCYAVLNASALAWDVNAYVVERFDGEEHKHKDRGGVVSATWDLWRAHKHQCRAPGFVVDFAKDRVAVPRECCLPVNCEIGAYRFVSEERFRVSAGDRKYHKLVCGILRDAVKKRFGFDYDGSLGPLWDLKLTGDHCWFPDAAKSGRFHYCRKFRVLPRFLVGDRLVLQIVVTTVMIDGMSFGDYYDRGEVVELASMIEAKLAKRGTKDGDPPQIRVLWNRSTPFQADAKVVELLEPDAVRKHGSLSEGEQRRLGIETAQVREYMKKPEDVALSQLFLILDPKITLGDHSETIIDPAERLELWEKIRESLDEAKACGPKLRLSESPFDLSEFEIVEIRPPAVRVRNQDGGHTIIDAPNSFTEDALRDRARRRDIHIRRHGFLNDFPIRPLIGWPSRFGSQSAERMKRDLNFILQRRRIPYSFNVELYHDVEDLRCKIVAGDYDSLLAVLPEDPSMADDTHDQIKRRIDGV